MTSTSPSPSGAGACSRNERASPPSVHHAQNRARARAPLAELGERVARRREGQQRAQAHDVHHHAEAEAEAAAEAKLAVDGAVADPTRRTDTAAHTTTERHLAETRANLSGPLVREHAGLAIVLVRRRSRALRRLHEEQRDEGAAEREQLHPQLPLELAKRPSLVERGRLEHGRKPTLDNRLRLLDGLGYGVLLRLVFVFHNRLSAGGGPRPSSADL